MPVCKIILRIDFPTSFEVMDRPGSLAKLLVDPTENPFFKEVQEERQLREIRASHRDGAIFRELKAAPNHVLFNYLNMGGIPLDAVRGDKSFSTLVHLITQIRREFGIQAENRSGFRLIYLSRLAKKRAATIAAFRSLLDENVVAAVGKTLADPSDIGLSFDGGEAGQVQYHVRCGPFLGAEEAGRYFEHLPPDCEITRDADFICDIDQFQTKTKMGPDLAWWKPLLTSAINLIPRIEGVLQRTLRE